jgi:ferredoxin
MNAPEQVQPLSALLPAATPNGRARATAMAAAEKVATRPTSIVSYRSTGALIVIGPEAAAMTAAAQLHPKLRCTVVVHEPQAPGTNSAAQPKPEFPVLREKVLQVSGHLGQFAVIVTAPAPLGGINLLQKLGSQRTHFDLVLDLTDPPFISAELLPFGYYAPRADAEALAKALAELPDMVGEFEKPRFFNYNPDICAHGASGLTACTRCLDTCPAHAIISIGEDVAVDPFLCQGAGVCATACPTGAMTYVYPSVADQLARIAELLKAYRAAGGERPVLVLHDAETGKARAASLSAHLPEHAIPFEIADLGAAGMDTWLAAIAYGATRVVLLATALLPKSVRTELETQIGYSNAILTGMGFATGLIELLTGNDAAVLERLEAEIPAPAFPPAKFAAFDEKRTTLRLAIEHLHAHAPAPRAVAALPAGAPFGEIVVNKEACTLCLACVSVCPTAALADGVDLPQLNFIEGNCVQCGLCQSACPEDAIRLSPRYLYDPEARRAARVLNEETPFHCIRCGKPFATQKMMDRMGEKLKTHWMFQTPEALRRMQMCGDCRVRDMFEAERSRKGV